MVRLTDREGLIKVGKDGSSREINFLWKNEYFFVS
jgi:hypothetical protein